MNMEVWKDIPDYNGNYQASTLGNIRSIEREVSHSKTGTQLVLGRVLKQTISNGYMSVILCVGGNRKFHSVHKLVALSFICNKENKVTINHKNGIKTDNRVENLEWNTWSENNKHAHDTGLNIGVRGEKVGSSKLKDSEILEIRELLELGESCVSIGKTYKVTDTTIGNIKLNKTWKHIK